LTFLQLIRTIAALRMLLLLTEAFTFAMTASLVISITLLR